LYARILIPQEGRLANRHGRGKQDAVDVSAAQASGGDYGRAKSCGPDSPTLESTPGSRAWGDGGSKPGTPRRSRISR